MRIDSLDDFYFNKCVMATSGNEYSISIVNDTIKKTIRLHAYFEEHIEMLINELNKHIPDSLQISYYTIERKKEQDCE